MSDIEEMLLWLGNIFFRWEFLDSLRQTRQTGKLWGAKSIGGSMRTVSPDRILRVDTRKRPMLSFRATLKALHDEDEGGTKKYT